MFLFYPFLYQIQIIHYQDKEVVSNLTATNEDTVNLYAVWFKNKVADNGNFVIAGILFLAVYVIKVKKKGNIAVLYLLLYSVGRFLVEFLRNDARGSVGALSTSQFIAIFTFVAGIALGVYINIVKKDNQSEKNEQKSDK